MLRTDRDARAFRCCGPDDCGMPVFTEELRQYARHCIGSVCMAWRIGLEAQHQPDCAAVKSAKFLTREECDCEMSPPLGYCGLAKMPEGI